MITINPLLEDSVKELEDVSTDYSYAIAALDDARNEVLNAKEELYKQLDRFEATLKSGGVSEDDIQDQIEEVLNKHYLNYFEVKGWKKDF